MGEEQMMAVQRELGGITESLKNAEEYRQEVLKRLDTQTTKHDEQNTRLNDKMDAQNDKIDKISRDLDGVKQTLISSGTAIANLTLENCGARLSTLENLIKGFPEIEKDVLFWRKVLGGTFGAIWKIGLAVISGGAVGGLLVKLTTHS